MPSALLCVRVRVRVYDRSKGAGAGTGRGAGAGAAAAAAGKTVSTPYGPAKVCESVSISISCVRALSLPLYLYLYLCISIPIHLSICQSRSFSLSLSISISISISLSRSHQSLQSRTGKLLGLTRVPLCLRLVAGSIPPCRRCCCRQDGCVRRACVPPEQPDHVRLRSRCADGLAATRLPLLTFAIKMQPYGRTRFIGRAWHQVV